MSFNDLVLLYFQDVEFLISVLNANGISLENVHPGRYEEIKDTHNTCYNMCVNLGYYEKEC